MTGRISQLDQAISAVDKSVSASVAESGSHVVNRS